MVVEQSGMTLRTDFDACVVADIGKRSERILRVVAALGLDLLRDVLGGADGLDVGRGFVLVDGAEEAARVGGRGDGSDSRERSDEEGLGEHVCGLNGTVELGSRLGGRERGGVEEVKVRWCWVSETA